MKTLYLLSIIAVFGISNVALAEEDGEALFIKNKCAACHKLDDKKVGPTLKGIAAKYAGDKEAVAVLEKKVRTGGVGVWGTMPMPRVPASVSDADIKTMVAWILTH